MYKYSASENTFFLVAVHGKDIPEDAKPIDKELHDSLLEQQAKGMLICADEDGYPVAVERPPCVVAHTSCTPSQGLIALFALKRITEANVLTAISNIPDEDQRYTAQIGYQRATVWDRASPTIQAMAQLLQLSEEDLDALFAYAVTVQV